MAVLENSARVLRNRAWISVWNGAEERREKEKKTKETRDNFPWRVGEKRGERKGEGRKARVEKNEREGEKERIEREGESRSKRRPVV